MMLSMPSTRAGRHAKIMRVLEEHRVTSQGQLRDLLVKEGIDVTQATLSRDLEELGATKEFIAGGTRVYRVGKGAKAHPSETVTGRNLLDRWAREVLTGARAALNQIVLRTSPGAAQMLAAQIDRSGIQGIIGTIAGDDTVLIITDSERRAARLCAEILSSTDNK